VVITYTATYAGSSEFKDVFPLKMLKTFAVFTLSLLTYATVFGCLSLLVQRSMIAGITYIAVVEGLDGPHAVCGAQVDGDVLLPGHGLNWLNVDGKMAESHWGIERSEAPEPIVCVLTLLTVSVLTTVLATLVFSQREFHVKTPEGN